MIQPLGRLTLQNSPPISSWLWVKIEVKRVIQIVVAVVQIPGNSEPGPPVNTIESQVNTIDPYTRYTPWEFCGIRLSSSNSCAPEKRLARRGHHIPLLISIVEKLLAFSFASWSSTPILAGHHLHYLHGPWWLSVENSSHEPNLSTPTQGTSLILYKQTVETSLCIRSTELCTCWKLKIQWSPWESE